jgi:hypothetical protein
MTTHDITRILERLAVIETKIDTAATQEARLSKAEGTLNKMIGALILLGAFNSGGILIYFIK